MPQTGLFIDTNLFVLLVAGSEGRELIVKHRRLEGYSAKDYDILLDLIRPVGQVFVTPNTLTETSNLLAQHGEPERSRLLQSMAMPAFRAVQRGLTCLAAPECKLKVRRVAWTKAEWTLVRVARYKAWSGSFTIASLVTPPVGRSCSGERALSVAPSGDTPTPPR